MNLGSILDAAVAGTVFAIGVARLVTIGDPDGWFFVATGAASALELIREKYIDSKRGSHGTTKTPGK